MQGSSTSPESIKLTSADKASSYCRTWLFAIQVKAACMMVSTQTFDSWNAREIRWHSSMRSWTTLCRPPPSRLVSLAHASLHVGCTAPSLSLADINKRH